MRPPLRAREDMRRGGVHCALEFRIDSWPANGSIVRPPRAALPLRKRCVAAAMAYPSTSWSYGDSPASLRRERRRASPAARAEHRRHADASSPSPAERHLADLQARVRAVWRTRAAPGWPGGAPEASCCFAHGSLIRPAARRTRSWTPSSAAAPRCAAATTTSRAASCARFPTYGARRQPAAQASTGSPAAGTGRAAPRARSHVTRRRGGVACAPCRTLALAGGGSRPVRAADAALRAAQPEHGRAAVAPDQASRHGPPGKQQQGVCAACGCLRRAWAASDASLPCASVCSSRRCSARSTPRARSW